MKDYCASRPDSFIEWNKAGQQSNADFSLPSNQGRICRGSLLPEQLGGPCCPDWAFTIESVVTGADLGILYDPDDVEKSCNQPVDLGKLDKAIFSAHGRHPVEQHACC